MNGEPLVILLVEDNPAHAKLVQISLKGNKVINTVNHVLDGEEALNYLRRKDKYADEKLSPRPNLVLLDLRLPKVDGIEVLKEIKTDEKLMDIPVVVLTTSDSETDVVKAYQNYANSYIIKPVDFEKFNKMMDDLGFYWLAWNKQTY